jgi:hypothetical protein
MHAMPALSQLSYGSTWGRGTLAEPVLSVQIMNGLGHPKFARERETQQ